MRLVARLDNFQIRVESLEIDSLLCTTCTSRLWLLSRRAHHAAVSSRRQATRLLLVVARTLPSDLRLCCPALTGNDLRESCGLELDASTACRTGVANSSRAVELAQRSAPGPRRRHEPEPRAWGKLLTRLTAGPLARAAQPSQPSHPHVPSLRTLQYRNRLPQPRIRPFLALLRPSRCRTPGSQCVARRALGPR